MEISKVENISGKRKLFLDIFLFVLQLNLCPTFLEAWHPYESSSCPSKTGHLLVEGCSIVAIAVPSVCHNYPPILIGVITLKAGRQHFHTPIRITHYFKELVVSRQYVNHFTNLPTQWLLLKGLCYRMLKSFLCFNFSVVGKNTTRIFETFRT